FVGTDASMVEVNPLVVLTDGKVLALDAKVTFDDNALYRQKDLEVLRDLDEEDPAETEAKRHDLSFIKLDGNIGCMVNGAGLAMATMDTIKHFGGQPANFLADGAKKVVALAKGDASVEGGLRPPGTIAGGLEPSQGSRRKQ